jgi:hypothetical protein
MAAPRTGKSEWGKLIPIIFGNALSTHVQQIPTRTIEDFLTLVVQESFQDTFVMQIAPFLHTLIPDTASPAATDIIELVSRTCRAIRGLDHRQRSIDDIVTAILQTYPTSTESKKEESLHYGRHVVFAILGCLTQTYSAVTNVTADNLSITPLSVESSDSQPLEKASRPLRTLLRGFRLPMIQIEEAKTKTSEFSLNVHDLNLSSLQTDVGGKPLDVVWVDDTRAHLHLDEQQGCLMIFRLPAFCLVNSLPECTSSIFHLQVQSRTLTYSQLISNNRIMDDYDVPVSQSQYQSIAVLHEILTTYRIIFGQSKPSRRLFHKSEKAKACKFGTVDPVLERLCGSEKHHLDCFLIAGQGQAHHTANFPHFGLRLEKLQAYATSRKPTRIREKWKDRRNRAEWAAFWTLLIVGALSILLSIIQIALAAAQLQVALRQL